MNVLLSWCFQIKEVLWIKIWITFNCLIDEGSYIKLGHLWSKQNFWSAFNWLIDEGNSFKLEHLFKSSSSNAFNWPIDEGSSFNSEQHDK
jgi:hypothetical protein